MEKLELRPGLLAVERLNPAGAARLGCCSLTSDSPMTAGDDPTAAADGAETVGLEPEPELTRAELEDRANEEIEDRGDELVEVMTEARYSTHKAHFRLTGAIQHQRTDADHHGRGR